MENLLFIFKSLLGFITGCLIGLAFGIVQRIAKERYEKRQGIRQLSTPWLVIPGSLTRTVFFIIALVFVQLACPMLFEDNVKWMVSGGVALGYAGVLLDEFRKKTAARKI
jgi:hypothetical protein